MRVREIRHEHADITFRLLANEEDASSLANILTKMHRESHEAYQPEGFPGYLVRNTAVGREDRKFDAAGMLPSAVAKGLL